MSGPRYSIIPADAVLDRELSRLALHVLAALGAHADNNGWCIVKQQTLADKIGSSAGSVANAIGELVRRGYVRVRARHADNGAQLASLYQVVMDREPSETLEDDGISSEGGSSVDEGGVHVQMKGGFIPTCTLNNDPSSKRPSSIEDKAKRVTPRDELLVVLDDERAGAVIEHRKRIGKPLTAYAAKLLARKFARTPDPHASAEAMIANGWQGFEPHWMDRHERGAARIVASKPTLASYARSLLAETSPQGGGNVIDHEG